MDTIGKLAVALTVLTMGCDGFGLFDDDKEPPLYPIHVTTWGDDTFFEAIRLDIKAAVGRWSRILAPTPTEPYVWAYDTHCFASEGGLDRAPLRDLGPVAHIPGAHAYGFAQGDTLPAGFHLIISATRLRELFTVGQYRDICATPDPVERAVKPFHPSVGTPVIGQVAMNSRAVYPSGRPNMEDVIAHEIGHALGASHDNWGHRFRRILHSDPTSGVILFPEVIRALNIPASEPQPVGIPANSESARVHHLSQDCEPEIMTPFLPHGDTRGLITEITAGMLYEGFSYDPEALDMSVAWSDTLKGWRGPAKCLATTVTIIDR